ncbi:hypothetical protein [Nocardia mexicana]|uniref:Uncharacterized protein n=1 Tax=Nocardia mexicana TaxID=279262 RepID=A0A370HCH3_9NOCA|nr:hypothetical protein [Nocardia mexicana]RDI54480.1 hypothetical protein DFR68_102608 [Nocardia mexicana]
MSHNSTSGNGYFTRPDAEAPGPPIPGWSADNVNEFVNACDRLVRHLFDAGLRLHKHRAYPGPDRAPRDPARPGDAELSAALDDLDVLIRDSGGAILALVRMFGADEIAHRGRRRW